MKTNIEKLNNMSASEFIDLLIDYLNNETNYKMLIYKYINEDPINYEKIYRILPMLDEDDMALLLKYDRNYSIQFLLSIVDKADELDLTKQALYLLKRYDIKYIIPLLPYIDEDIIRSHIEKKRNASN